MSLSALNLEGLEWVEDAACAGLPTSLFFDKATTARALDVCTACPVRQQCSEHGEAFTHGIYGGAERE